MGGRWAGGSHRLVLASSRIFQITRCMQALASSLELCPSTAGQTRLLVALAGEEGPQGRPLTIVLDDLSEVVGHEVPQGALIGEAQAVREQYRCVHHGAVDDLWAGGQAGYLRTWADAPPHPMGPRTKIHRDSGHNPDGCYLQGQQVTLQAMSNEDGVGAEHAQQDSLDVPQRDACVREVSLCYP